MAFVFFDGMTMLDLIGFYDAVTRMGRIPQAIESMSWDFCSNQAQITDDRGLTMKVDQVSPNLSGYDLVFIPGGMATRQLQFDTDFISWIQTAQDVEYKASVCTGALILGAAGFLNGKKATTNPSAYELLVPYCSEVVKERFVRDGNVFTGGGVSASLDLGLYFVECLTNAEVARQVQERMDYPYYRAGK